MEKPTVQATVVFLVNTEGRIGLAQKKQAIHHDKGEISYSLGLYNGWGGKQEVTDPTILDTAVRELFDESGVIAKKEDLEPVFRAYFYTKNKEGEGFLPFMDVSFYFLRTWQGTPAEGKEMGPAVFFEQENLPYDQMMPADKYLIEQALLGVRGVFEVKLHGKTTPPDIRLLDEML